MRFLRGRNLVCRSSLPVADEMETHERSTLYHSAVTMTKRSAICFFFSSFYVFCLLHRGTSIVRSLGSGTGTRYKYERSGLEDRHRVQTRFNQQGGGWRARDERSASVSKF